MNRRTMLTSAAGLAAGTASLLFPGLPAVASVLVGRSVAHTSPGELDPTFSSGLVIATAATGLVIRSDVGQRAIRYQPATSTWKETFVPVASIAVGDSVDVKGVPQTDGSLTADQIWVNITRFGGTFVSADLVGFQVRTPNGQTRSIQASPFLEVVDSQNQPRAEALTGLRAGDLVGGVGVHERDGTIRATRLWVYH